jgi:hypothetical protein
MVDNHCDLGPKDWPILIWHPTKQSALRNHAAFAPRQGTPPEIHDT